MKTILWVALMAAVSQEPVGTTLTYSVQGAEKKEIQATYKAPKAGTLFRMGYEGLPSPMQNLPLWLPPGLRKAGAVIYDDGQGFKHDVGEMKYSIRSTGTWKGFDVLSTSYWFQGMRRESNWALEAHYDKDSGFLLWAVVTKKHGDEKSVLCELTLTASSDTGLTKKLK